MTTKEIFDEALGSEGLIFGGIVGDSNVWHELAWTITTSIPYDFRQEYDGSFSSGGSSDD